MRALEQVWLLILRDLKTKNRRTFLGVLWVFLSPILATAVIVGALSAAFSSDLGGGWAYVLWTLSGVSFLQFTGNALPGVASAILASKSLLQKIDVSPSLFFFSAIASGLIPWITVTIALALLSGLLGNSVSPLLVVAVLLYAGFILGLGVVISTINYRYEDLNLLLPLIPQLLLFVTPVFYPTEIIPRSTLIILELNPFYWYLSIFRTSLGVLDFDYQVWFWALGSTVGGLLLALFAFRRNFPRMKLFL